jgi:maltose alpha-D-glucosyltransferase / alpha-amylase
MRRKTGRALRPRGVTPEPEWYKDAVIYELRVRSFFDGNDDGVGDFAGLTAKLDYLADLGVTALWLLPFYPSPLKDDGYDIADYTDVHPDMGTIADFRAFLDAAHERGLSVITELVLNHTSDQHPWFQRARRAELGSAERNFYVWSPTAEPYADARIIFKDFETSNWTWDPVASAYFWHRFYSHQPDLNFDNPEVQSALFGVVDFWLGLGVDGLRLDAVPYLYEEEGTNCENLPRTHAFLRKLRAHVDAHFPNRMLLAEANQWPEDAAAYFGAGDECHMNFHFPIMPRMFMAIVMEDSFPIIDILAQTPTPPASCQWALFLRNHDELTLEMVTDDERDYMYRAYASDAAARINLGIRRRLAPLVGNDRRKVELLNGLLFSLSGTPVLYYGDEIGMGDNIFLGDRNGVRTPMQWSMDRNAGFSRAHTQRLILPVNTDSEYHYESLNVETQQNNPSSLLWWTKKLIALRRDYRAFGAGSLDVLTVANPRVFSFLRRLGDQIILVVANLSRAVQYVELDLSPYKGLRPVELFGGAVFPPVGDHAFPLTLGGHSFYWLSLERAVNDPALESTADESSAPLARLLEGITASTRVPDLEEQLAAYLSSKRKLVARGRDLDRVRLVDVIKVGAGEDAATCVLIRAEYVEGEPDVFPLWIGLGAEGVTDVLEEAARARVVMRALASGKPLQGRLGRLTVAASVAPTWDEHSVPHAVAGAHENTVVQIEDLYVLKIFRRLTEGSSLDLELARALARAGAPLRVPIVAAFEYTPLRGEPSTLALLDTFIPNAGTAWHQALAELGRYFERVLTAHRGDAVPEAPPTASVTTSVTDEAPSPQVSDLLGTFIDTMGRLGERTGDLHQSLAGLHDPAFAPETYGTLARRSEYQSLRNLAGVVLRDLREHASRLAGDAAADATFVLERRGAVLKRFEPLLTGRGHAVRIRTHGDYHLEQVLFTGKDFVILDFEGEHDRSYNDRRRKRSPLRDVASMLRSIDNASLVALWEPGTVREVDRALLSPWAGLWSAWMSSAFMRGYLRAIAGSAMLANTDAAEASRWLDAFALERTLRDLRVELAWRAPGTIIPLRALAQMLEPDPVRRVSEVPA